MQDFADPATGSVGQELEEGQKKCLQAMDLGDVGPPGVSSLAMAWQSETEWRFSERWETRIKLNGGAEKLPCLMTGGYIYGGHRRLKHSNGGFFFKDRLAKAMVSWFGFGRTARSNQMGMSCGLSNLHVWDTLWL